MIAFRTFGPLHQAILAVVTLAAVLCVAVARSPWGAPWRFAMGRVLGTIVVGNELLYWVWQWQHHTWRWPLQICDLAVFLTGWALWQPQRWRVGELAYFWGLAATTQALLTPDLPDAISPYYCAKFFLTHGGIVVSVVYLAAALGWRPQAGVVWRMLGVTNLYAAAIGIFNIIAHKNYLYLCAKPQRPSILDWLGPWPWYILWLEVAAVLLFGVCAAPWWWNRGRRHA